MNIRGYLALSVATVAITAGILFGMGRVPICECGHISLWNGVVASAENSQQISDWYSASHFIHGILFFALLSYVFRRMSLGARLLVATIIEAGWEILENSPLIIDRYRAVTVSWGYSGDSILNSVSDIVFMWFGFFFARYVPWWVSVLAVIALELFVGYMIRDNLALNILMLVYPLESIRLWQSGG